MYENLQVEQFFIPPAPNPEPNLQNIVAYLNEANQALQNDFDNSPQEERVTSNSQSRELTKQSSIYVCTFCQVFATSDLEIAAHIAKEHGQCLKAGTLPENYVSKLKALKSEKIVNKKGGRPRKSITTSPPLNVEETTVPIPVLGPDGLYWCKKCHRHFKKPRQLTMHVCVEADEQDTHLDESDVDEDDTVDFKTYMDVESVPWSKRKRHKNVDENLQTLGTEDQVNRIEKGATKVVHNWRDDPAYVPLFKNENDKQEFEDHLKTIDYSSVDNLFNKVVKKSKAHKNKTTSSKYSCVMCKKVLNSLSHIRLHCLIHTDLKPFTCPKCSFRSNVKGSLYTHMRSHTGNMFCCTQCSFQSTKRSHLLDHEQTHSTIPQFCKLCKNSYKTLKSLVLHVKRYHNNSSGKKYLKSMSAKQLNKVLVKCSICDKKLNSRSSLQAHIQQFHPGISCSEQLANQEVGETIPKGLFDAIDFSNLQCSSSSLLNCRVQIEPLDEQLVSYLQKDIKGDVPSQYNMENPNHSMTSTSALGDVHELIEKVPGDTLQDIGFLDLQSLSSSLFDCRVRIEPLDDRLLSYHQSMFKCNICDQLLSSQSDLETHKQQNHSSKGPEISEKLTRNRYNGIIIVDPQLPPSLLECSVRIEPLSDQLVEIMLNNLLEQKSTQSVELYDNVFQQSQDAALLTSDTILDRDLSPKALPGKLLPMTGINQFNLSGLEECLDECFKSDITKPCTQAAESNSSTAVPPFDMPEISINYPDTKFLPSNIPGGSRDILQLETELVEQKPEEIKLFEKCKRAPAYVCCVCSGIFICPSTLKGHLKEHVNSSSLLMEQPVEKLETNKLPDDRFALGDVCRMLQDNTMSDVDKELEKLFTSSLDRMWYLPEVSVVLGNDQGIIDAVLDDISDFSTNGKFEESESLQLENEMFS